MGQDKKRVASELVVIIVASCLSAIGLYVFVYPANFAPSGVDGIATMVQSLTNINAGVISLIINIPILLIAWFCLNKKYVGYTLIFTVIHSILLIFLSSIKFYQYMPLSDKWIPAVFSGILLGIRTGMMIKIGGSSGGIDIIGSMIQQEKPYVNIERPISVLCYFIIGISFFVYKQNLECILLSITQMFVFSQSMGIILNDTRNAIEVKIITSETKKLTEDIIKMLKHGGTLLNCKGLYTDNERKIILCVINTYQIGELLQIVKKYPNTFTYFLNVNGVWGNFRWNKSELPH